MGEGLVVVFDGGGAGGGVRWGGCGLSHQNSISRPFPGVGATRREARPSCATPCMYGKTVPGEAWCYPHGTVPHLVSIPLRCALSVPHSASPSERACVGKRSHRLIKPAMPYSRSHAPDELSDIGIALLPSELVLLPSEVVRFRELLASLVAIVMGMMPALASCTVSL